MIEISLAKITSVLMFQTNYKKRIKTIVQSEELFIIYKMFMIDNI